jgi:hypothetical protein
MSESRNANGKLELMTKLRLGQEYAALASARNAVEADEYVSKKLIEAVDEGEVEILPALYAHRAVWRLQLGLVRKAEKDLLAALRCNLSKEAAMEVRVLLIHCYRELHRAVDAAKTAEEVRQHLARETVVSALILRQMLGSTEPQRQKGSSTDALENMGIAQNAPDLAAARALREVTPAKPLPPSEPAAATACMPPTDVAPPPAKQTAAATSKTKRGSMSSGFLAASTSPKPGSASLNKAAATMPPNVTHAAPSNVGPPAAPPTPPVTTAATPNGISGHLGPSSAIVADDGVIGAKAEPGQVSIVDLDEDDLETALNATPKYSCSMSQQAQQKLVAVMGGPGALFNCCCSHLSSGPVHAPHCVSRLCSGVVCTHLALL